MARINFDLEDLTNAALKRMVKQLLTASEAQEKKIMSKHAEKNELADLDEEMHGKPNTPKVEDDDAFDLEVEVDEDGEESDTDAAPKKKGRK